MTEQLVPFLKPRPGDKVWVVRFEGLRLGSEDGAGSIENPYIKSVTVFISSETGQVVKVVSDWPEDQPLTKPFPRVEREEQQMQRISEIFTELPLVEPRITLAQAMEKAYSMATARQLIAYYVKAKHAAWPEARALWVVHCWGIPPFMPIGPPGLTKEQKLALVPEHARNHLRSEIDALTGRWYGANTIPQPEP